MFNLKVYLFVFLVSVLLSAPAKAEEQKSDPKLHALMALHYLQGYVKAPEHTKVIVYNRGLTDQGYSLYSSGHAGAATLINMKGHVLQEWSYDIKKI